MATPAFLEAGGTLAFACQHMYPHESGAFLKTNIVLQLKGADACLVSVARSLGLAVDIKPRFDVEPPYYEGYDYEDYEYSTQRTRYSEYLLPAGVRKDYFGDDFGLEACGGFEEGESDFEAIVDRLEVRRGLIWCHDPVSENKELAQVCSTYGKLGSDSFW